MRGERWLLSVGRFLVARAARRLPAAARDERRREWEAELPVILGDPEIKPAAARAARMLWFAADTLRGTVLRSGPGPARHRGAHRGPATWGKDARVLGVGVALLTGAAILLAGFAYLVYQTVAGVTLPFFVCFFLTSLAGFASRLVRRQPPGQCWYSAAVAATATGQFADALAARLGWGPPLLFTVISYGSYAVLAACVSVVAVRAIRYAARRVRRSGPRGLCASGKYAARADKT
jgi:hypothetical protein